MAEWLKECEICNAGLVAEMDSQISAGLSQRAGAKVLEAQQQDKLGDVVYSAEAILQRYRYHRGKKTVCQIDTPPHGLATVKVIDLEPNPFKNYSLLKENLLLI